MRLQVERMPASSTWGKEVSCFTASSHLSSGTAIFSRTSTGHVWIERPMDTIEDLASDA